MTPNIIEVKLDKNPKKVFELRDFSKGYPTLVFVFADLFTARTKSSKSSLSGPAAKRVKREKKKMMDKSNKTSNGKSTFKGKQRDDGDFREKGFKSRKSSRPGGGKSNGKTGLKGVSKVHRKR